MKWSALFLLLSLAPVAIAETQGELAVESEPAGELPDKPPVLTLGKVDAESTDDATMVNIRFSSELDWDNVDISDHGTFLQIELPNTVVPNPGQFVEGSGEYLKKMAMFQITPQTGAVRLFVSADALLVKKASKADILGDRILISIDHDELTKLIANDPKVTAAPESAQTADEVIAATEVDDDVPEPAALLQTSDDKVQVAHVVKEGFDFQNKLVSVAVFCGLLLVGMMGFLLLAPRIKKAHLARTSYDDVKMRSLASHSVAPKQKLELIDVAGQQILIGVTPGNINFLTTINPRQASTPVAQPAIPARQVPMTQIASPSPQKTAHTSLPSGSRAQIQTAPKKPRQNEAISDVTKLIREKLKNIPTV